MNTNYWPPDIQTVRRMIINGETCVLNVVQRTLAWIDEANPAVNAIVDTAPAEALGWAGRIDADVGAAVNLPLAGGLVTVKEGIPVARMRCSMGLKGLHARVAKFDVPVLKRLREAGAVFIGSSNMAEGFANWQTDNPIYGRSNNPFNLARTPGGSGGGGAAAVASGFGHCDIGTDLIGSVRIPAAFCGLYGLRPTAGACQELMWSKIGGGPRTLSPVPIIGLMTRSADDLRAIFSVIMNDEPEAHNALATATTNLKIGWIPHSTTVRFNPQIADKLAHCRQLLIGQVAEIIEMPEDALGELDNLVRFAMVLSKARILYDMGHFDRKWVAARSPVTADDLISAIDGAEEIVARVERAFEQVDVVLLPMTPLLPFSHLPGIDITSWDTSCPVPVVTDGLATVPYWQVAGYAAPASLSGHPSLSCPVGFTQEGLPIAIQMIGRRHSETTLIALTRVLSSADENIQRKPEGLGEPLW